MDSPQVQGTSHQIQGEDASAEANIATPLLEEQRIVGGPRPWVTCCKLFYRALLISILVYFVFFVQCIMLIYIGSTHFDVCPASPFLPKVMIAYGSFGLILNASGLFFLMMYAFEDAITSIENEIIFWMIRIGAVLFGILGILSLLSMVGLIFFTGKINRDLYFHVQYDNPNDPLNYCDKEVARFANWYFGVGILLLGLGIIVVFLFQNAGIQHEIQEVGHAIHGYEAMFHLC